MLPEFLIILGTVYGAGLVVGVLMMRVMKRLTAQIDARSRAADERANKYFAEAAADRRAMQVSMDAHRAEMQRPAERRTGPERAAPTPRSGN